MTIDFVFGTRPEAIKMAPVIKKFQEEKEYHVRIIATGQHKSLLIDTLNVFDLKPTINFDVMMPNQDLTELFSKILLELKLYYKENGHPNMIFVQGDTTTTLAGALYAYYNKINLAYIEAGLRSGDLFSPFPEEGNRKMVSTISQLQFSPTEMSYQKLIEEGFDSENIYITGNTSIDALNWVLSLNENMFEKPERQFILVTTHRRENFGAGIINICEAIISIAHKHSEFDIIIPVHPNPNIKNKIYELLSRIENVKLIEPLEYVEFCHYMKHAYIILTDSGGVQEEAPTLGKPVLVLRDTTERPEGVSAGTSILVGTNLQEIVSQVSLLLNNKEHYLQMSNKSNPFGDGNSAKIIFDVCTKYLSING